MSRSIGRHNLLKAIAQRNFSAEAATHPVSQNDLKVEISTKRIRIVSIQENNPLAKISFSFKAGSRYELPDSYGITHVLRKATGLSTSKFFPFNIARNLQQEGINLYSSVDRETFTITVETHPDKVDTAFRYLNSIATEPQFKPWEVSDNRKHVKLDLLVTPPQAKVIDMLHTIAFRTGLGNSLFVDPSRISKLGNEHLMQFHNEHFTAKRLQITTCGVPLSIVNELITHVNLDPVKGPAAIKSTFYGGEIRALNYEEPNTFISVAGETPGYSKKEFLPYAVLSYVYGNGVCVPYGNGQGILNKALKKSGAIAAVSGFRANYSDSGLVGFFLVADSNDVVKAYDIVFNAFLKADITDEDVVRGKNQLKAAIAQSGNGIGLVDALASQVTLESVSTPQQIMALVDSVTTADVKQAAKKIIDGKLACATYGDISSIPPLEQYKK